MAARRTEPAHLLARFGLVAALFVAAAFYFRLGATSSIEWGEEGMLVYPSWRVAEGAVPFREFRHGYGPLPFLLNGGLLAAFGPDLLVIRLSLAAVKALVAVLTYMLARQVASPAAALLVWAILVAVWGTPVWVFNAPYASHYCFAVSLGGLLAFLTMSGPGWVRFAVAGVAFGVVALFKQTLGLFVAIAFALAWMFARQRGAAPEPKLRVASPIWSPAARAANLVLLLTVLGVYCAYTARHVLHWSTLIMLTPAAAGVVSLAIGEVRGIGTNAARVQYLKEIVVFGAAFAAPLVLCAGLYFKAGLLPALVFNMLNGLPQRISWFVPLPAPQWRTMLAAALIVSACGLARALRIQTRSHAAVAYATVLGVAVLIGLVAFTATHLEAADVWRYLGGGFALDVGLLGWWLPLVVVCALFRFVFASLPTARLHGRSQYPAAELAQLWFLAVAGLLTLYPAADLPHVGMILPAVLPLTAYCLDRYLHVPGTDRWRGRVGVSASVILVALLSVVVAWPFVAALISTTADRPREVHGFERASEIWVPGRKFADAVSLVDFLRATARPPDGVFVIANEQLLYVFTGMRSPLEPEELYFYLIGTDLISPGDIRAVIDESAVLTRLERSKPLIVDYEAGEAGRRFRQALPAVARHIAERYRVLRRFGEYAVLSTDTVDDGGEH